MTPACRKTLKLMRKLTDTSEKLIIFDERKCDIVISCKAENRVSVSEFKNEIKGIFAYLSEKGYIAYDDPYNFYLTHKGLHSVYFSWEALRDFLAKSVLVPILVALVTSLLANIFIN